MKTITFFSVVLSLAACADDPVVDLLPLGTNDALTMNACEAYAGSAAIVDLVAADTELGAADVILDPSTPTRVHVDGTGWITFRSDIEHFDWAIFTEDVDGAALTGLTFADSLRSPCDGLTDHRVHVHAAEGFPLRLDGHGDIWVYSVSAASTHAMSDGGVHDGMHHLEDGGAHHDEDGGSHHDEDGGSHHDEDGGSHHDEDGGSHHDHDAS